VARETAPADRSWAISLPVTPRSDARPRPSARRL
jgi:hypothetical protein